MPRRVKQTTTAESPTNSPNTPKQCITCNQAIKGRLKKYCRDCFDLRRQQKQQPTEEDHIKCKICKMFKNPVEYTIIYKSCVDCRTKKTNRNKDNKNINENCSSGGEDVKDDNESISPLGGDNTNNNVEQKQPKPKTTKPKIDINKLQRIISYLQNKYNIEEDINKLLEME
jgi:hypothetical protein